MNECLCCEKQFAFEDSTAVNKDQYCTSECELIFEAALKEGTESAKIKGLVDAEGNSILGNAYQQAVQRTIREAAGKIGIKLPSSTEE
jgi:hypothetical protein